MEFKVPPPIAWDKILLRCSRSIIKMRRVKKQWSGKILGHYLAQALSFEYQPSVIAIDASLHHSSVTAARAERIRKHYAALKHDSVPIRIAACMCIKSISRSVMGVAALEAICNVAIGFTHQNHPIFVHCRGVTQLVQLATSMDSSIRFKSVCALRNLLFLADEATARSILSELTVSTLANLISEPELLIQEQALALTAKFHCWTPRFY